MANETNIKGIERGRAKFAYECAERGSKIKNNKGYRAYTKKIPMMIKTNGLGATFAFVKSKVDNNKDKDGYAYKCIYENTILWLKDNPKELIDLSCDKDLVYEIIKLDSFRYRALTIEILAFFNWLRRFAEGLIVSEE